MTAFPGFRRSQAWLRPETYPAGVVGLLFVHVWAVSGVSPFSAGRLFLATACPAIGILVVVRVLVRDRHAGAIVGLLGLLAVVAGGRSATWLLVIPAIVFVVLERRTARLAVDWQAVGRAVKVGTGILGLAVLLEIVELGRVGDLITTVQWETPLRPRPIVAPAVAAPDIFVILLDGYARQDVLVERFGLDNSAFLDGLRDRGFVVSDNSHSNYSSTNPSLSSFLNHRQLDEMPGFEPLLADPTSVEGPVVHRAISRAAVLDEFRAAGYESIAIASGFAQVNLRSADSFVDTGQISAFEIALLKSSVAIPLVTSVDPDAFSRSQRERIASVLATAGSIAGSPSNRPRFVFAHVPSPHAPWVDDATGLPRVVSNLDTWFYDSPEATGLSHDEVVAAYADQATYVGALTLDTVDRILADDTREAVILVISDHGSALDVGTSDREVRLRNLFAAHTPSHPSLFGDDATLVNVFPSLFGAYLAVDLPMSDETIYTAGPRGVYDLVPVTSNGID